MRRFAIIVLLGAVSTLAVGQSWTWQGSRITLSGEGHRFSIIPPRGWSIDTVDRAMRAAVRAVLYTGEGKSPFERMHVALATKRVEGEKTLRNLLDYVYPGVPPPNDSVSVEDRALTTSDGKPVTVKVTRTFRSQTAVAYIDDAQVVVVISHHLGVSNDHFTTKFRDFVALVESWKAEGD